MTIQLKLFASLREQTGVDFEQLELPSGVATLGDLRDHLRGRGPQWAEALDLAKASRGAINQRMAQETDAIKDGDEVAFFPPVTGG
jgi:molybdopterin synthase sulfur carrier subunit